jgi:hypothetical protein
MNRLIPIVFMTLFISNTYAQKFIGSHTVGDETKSYSKILVIVKVQSTTRRVEMEDDIVKRLKNKDISAVPSYLRISNDVLKAKGKDEDALEAFVLTLRKRNFDGILITSVVEASKSVDYDPGQYHTTTVPVRYGRFGRYYGSARVAVYEPGSVEKHKNFVMESLLYDLRASTKENSLHWIGKIKITDPDNFDKTSNKYAKMVVKELTKKAIE